MEKVKGSGGKAKREERGDLSNILLFRLFLDMGLFSFQCKIND